MIIKKTIIDYLLDGGIKGRCFFNKRDNQSYKVLDISHGIGAGYSLVLLNVKYEDGKTEELSLISSWHDLEIDDYNYDLETITELQL